MEQAKGKAPYHHLPSWDEQTPDLLRLLNQGGITTQQIATKLGRTKGAVIFQIGRLKKSGISFADNRCREGAIWTPQRISELKALKDQGQPLKTIAAAYGINRSRVCRLINGTTRKKTYPQATLSHHPLHATWANMVSRCSDPQHPNYQNYGARGITVCDRWLVCDNFKNDMGLKPSPDRTLDRRDNDGNYEPTNCRWATRTQQNLNTRRARQRASSQSVHITNP